MSFSVVKAGHTELQTSFSPMRLFAGILNLTHQLQHTQIIYTHGHIPSVDIEYKNINWEDHKFSFVVLTLLPQKSLF